MRPLSEFIDLVFESDPARWLGKNGEGGAFQLFGLHIIASWGDLWDHVSVSRRDRCPTWSEMEMVKRKFFKDTEVAFELHVPPSKHINIHPYCLHMWRPHNAEIPLPPEYMI